jgi:hypothetical protein
MHQKLASLPDTIEAVTKLFVKILDVVPKETRCKSLEDRIGFRLVTPDEAAPSEMGIWQSQCCLPLPK